MAITTLWPTGVSGKPRTFAAKSPTTIYYPDVELIGVINRTVSLDGTINRTASLTATINRTVSNESELT